MLLHLLQTINVQHRCRWRMEVYEQTIFPTKGFCVLWILCHHGKILIFSHTRHVYPLFYQGKISLSFSWER